MSNQDYFNKLAGKKRKGGDDDDGGDNQLGNQSNSMKRLFNKMPPEGLIGDAEKKNKEIVILSKKAVDGTSNDISTLSEKVMLKDLVAVLKSDSRLAHKPIIYQLQNRVKWPINKRKNVTTTMSHRLSIILFELSLGSFQIRQKISLSKLWSI